MTSKDVTGWLPRWLSGFTHLTSAHHWLKKATITFWQTNKAIEYTPSSLGNKSSKVPFCSQQCFLPGWNTASSIYACSSIYCVHLHIFLETSATPRCHYMKPTLNNALLEGNPPQKIPWTCILWSPPKWVPFNAETTIAMVPIHHLKMYLKKTAGFSSQLCEFSRKISGLPLKAQHFPRGKLSVNSFLLIIWFPAAPPSMKVKASWVIDESVDDPVWWMDSHHVFFFAN